MSKHELNTPASADILFKDAEERMKHTIEHLKQDLAGFRTGRANPAMVERIMVDYHGTPTPTASCSVYWRARTASTADTALGVVHCARD